VVYEIANTAKSKGLGTQEEVTNFTVKMRVLDKDINLRPGMSMTADVETETHADVLSVPIQSVTTRMPKAEQAVPAGEGGPPQGGGMAAARTRSENKPKEIVFVVDGGVVKAINVKRGISNDTHVEILEGLSEGAQVVSGSYKAINRELEDGAKVRVEEQKKQGAKTGAAS
jgi:HlyD family secretion protein